MGRSLSLRTMTGTGSMPMRLMLFVALLVGLVALHHETYTSMMQSWLGNTTYNHGFVIPLIALFFAWQRRHQATRVASGVWWPGFVLLAALSALWTMAAIVNVQVIAQFASVAMISALVLALGGPAVALVFALPLVYLIFAVPFGQGIVPLLMDWTADFTVGALHLVGIPVIRDGLYFSIPSGNFEVAEACSGVRYLLASAAAGVAFAFLSYNGWKKRSIFIAAALVVPLVANGLRAFGIVIIAHYSDLRLATGVDHFIYGWFFFGVILLILFLIGARYADDHLEPALPAASTTGFAPSEFARRPSTLAAAGLLALSLIAAGPAFTHFRTIALEAPQPALPKGPGPAGAWEGPMAPGEDWRLGYRGAADELAAAYRQSDSGQRVEVRLAAYGVQRQGAELVNALNRIVAGEGWRINRLGTVATPSHSIPRIRAVRATLGARTYLIWYWYQQGEQSTTSHYEAKLLEALAIANPSPAAVVAIGMQESDGEADAVLRAFLSDTGDTLRRCAVAQASDDRCLHPGAQHRP